MAVKVTGSGKPTEQGIISAATSAGIEVRAFRAVIAVETNGHPFDSAGRLTMLFEPHIFFALLKGDPAKLGLAVDQGLAYSKWGTKPYPKDSYPHWTAACVIDEELACQAASWGLGQILGENYHKCTYRSAKEMVEHMAGSADAQLNAVADFIHAERLVDALNKHDWATFAKGYNGSRYKTNAYDTKLAKAYASFPATTVKGPPMPDKTPTATVTAPLPPNALSNTPPSTDISWAQQRLKDLGYFEVGVVDGNMGARTEGAILAFRNENHLPLDPNVDDDLKLALISAKPREVAPERLTATVADLKPASPILQAAGTTKLLSYGTAAVGAVISIAAALPSNIGAAHDDLAPFKEVFAVLPPWAYGVASVILAGLIWVQAQAVETARVKQFQTGKTS